MRSRSKTIRSPQRSRTTAFRYSSSNKKSFDRYPLRQRRGGSFYLRSANNFQRSRSMICTAVRSIPVPERGFSFTKFFRRAIFRRAAPYHIPCLNFSRPASSTPCGTSISTVCMSCGCVRTSRCAPI